LVGRTVTYASDVDASKDDRAESFGREVMAVAPQNAMVFAKGDRAIFALWYFHFALHERPDLSVMASDLLHFDWYQQNLHSTYPSLVIPGPFPWPETLTLANPSRPACYVQYAGQIEIECAGPIVKSHESIPYILPAPRSRIETNKIVLDRLDLHVGLER
jgi:hypothetical protein